MLRSQEHERSQTRPRFRVARNPDQKSRLPYLISLPIEGGLVLKARDTWPRATRVFCAQDTSQWDESAGLLDDVPVLALPATWSRDRSGARAPLLFALPIRLHGDAGTAGDLVANPKDGTSCHPGARIPRGRSAGPLTIVIDTREKHGWKFAGRPLTTERRALAAGDYAVIVDDVVVAVVERKTWENLAASLSDGRLAFQMQRLAEVTKAAIVVEGDYPDLFRSQLGRGSWLADMLGRLAVRYPEVPVVFAGSRRFAEQWAYRFFGAAVADRTESS